MNLTGPDLDNHAPNYQILNLNKSNSVLRICKYHSIGKDHTEVSLNAHHNRHKKINKLMTYIGQR